MVKSIDFQLSEDYRSITYNVKEYKYNCRQIKYIITPNKLINPKVSELRPSKSKMNNIYLNIIYIYSLNEN